MTVDFHTHVFPDRIAEATVVRLGQKGGIPSYSDGTLLGLESALAEAEVDLGINLPVLTRSAQYASVTEFALGINRRAGVISRETLEKADTPPTVVSFAGLHPDDDDPEGRIEELRSLGFLGIKLHPDYQGVFFDDGRYIRILQAAKDAGMITVTHAGFDVAFPGDEIRCTPIRVAKVLDKLGGYPKLVLAHMGGNRLLPEVLSTIAGEDVYLDTSYVLPHITQSDFEKLLAKHGHRRILFASDSPWSSIRQSKNILLGYKIGKTAEDRILGQNALELLGI